MNELDHFCDFVRKFFIEHPNATVDDCFEASCPKTRDYETYPVEPPASETLIALQDSVHGIKSIIEKVRKLVNEDRGSFDDQSRRDFRLYSTVLKPIRIVLPENYSDWGSASSAAAGKSENVPDIPSALDSDSTTKRHDDPQTLAESLSVLAHHVDTVVTSFEKLAQAIAEDNRDIKKGVEEQNAHLVKIEERIEAQNARMLELEERMIIQNERMEAQNDRMATIQSSLDISVQSLVLLLKKSGV